MAKLSVEPEFPDHPDNILEGKVYPMKKAVYTMGQRLGRGAFGTVYKICRKSDKAEFAMKVEKIKPGQKKEEGIQLEMEILVKMKGELNTLRYMVLTLLGPSIGELKDERKNLFLATGLRVLNQLFDALEELHGRGFIHREIHPRNLCIGLGRQKAIVYLLDFGLARRYATEKLTWMTPRAKATGKGHGDYKAIACHMQKELGPKEDCESAVYLFVSLVKGERISDGARKGHSSLPWENSNISPSEILKKKQDLQNGKGRLALLGGLKWTESLWKIYEYTFIIYYGVRVNYSHIRGLIKDAAKSAGVSLDAPFEWEKEDA